MASVKKEDIPIMAMFMPKLWESVKEFYLVELTDEYSKAAYDRCVELIEIYPDPLAKEFVLAFCKFIDSKQKELKKMYSTKNRYEQGQALRKEIYTYIVSYIKLVGYAPSVTEISEKVDAGRATVWKHINQLIDDGLLRTNHPSTDRAYAPVGYGLRKTSKETK